MKAKLIRENIKFQRGQDPKSSMNIGIQALYKDRNLSNVGTNLKFVRDLLHISKMDIEDLYLIGSLDEYQGDFDETYEKYIEGKENEYIDQIGNDNWQFLLYNTPIGNIIHYQEDSGYQELWTDIETFLKIDKAINESLDFERGKDPIDSMDIGLKTQYKRYCLDYIKFDSDFKEELSILMGKDPKDIYRLTTSSNTLDLTFDTEFDKIYNFYIKKRQKRDSFIENHTYMYTMNKYLTSIGPLVLYKDNRSSYKELWGDFKAFLELKSKNLI